MLLNTLDPSTVNTKAFCSFKPHLSGLTAQPTPIQTPHRRLRWSHLNSETSNKSIEIVIPDDYPPVFDDSAALARLRRLPGIKVRTYSDRPQNSEELIQRISGAHTVVLARSNTRLTNRVLESTSPDLKHIALLGTATDHVSLEATRRLGVIVTNTPNSSTVAVAEHALALLFSLARKIPQLDQRVRIGAVSYTHLTLPTKSIV